MRRKRALMTKNQEVSTEQATEEMYHNAVGYKRSKRNVFSWNPQIPKGKRP
jgi:hypothetical protein